MSIQDLFWRGECLDSPLAFDTETDSRCDLTREVPRLALASASDGDRLVLLRPEQLPQFIQVHERHEWVGHNLASFDFWVVDQDLERQCTTDSAQAQNAWWDLADQGRMHDTLLMDLLVRIALGRGESGSEESKLFPRNLALVAREYAPHVPEPDKSSEFRLRYHELIESSDWDSFPSGFFTYPLEDARATWWVWRALLEQARTLKLKAPPGRIYEDAEARFGVLTERLQVQGAIALAQATRHGLAVNQPLLAEREAAVRAGIEESLEWLQLTHLELFEFKKKSGKMVRQAKSQLPKFKTKVLQGLLSREAEAQGRAPLRSHGKKAADPKFKNTLATVSVSVKEWATTGLARSESNPSGSLFLKHWLTVADSKTTLGLFAAAKACEGSVHPSYRTLVSTGRCSCFHPNLQQFPKGSGFREAFVARPGCVLYVCDYAAIELRTLAAICLARFGRSTLAEIFKRPKPFDDPHAYTASLVMGVPFEEFLSWKKSPDSEKQAVFKARRQASKACFHPDVEALTMRGWVKVSELLETDLVAQYWPGTGTVEFEKPLALTTRENQPLVRVHNEGIDLRVTPDHRMLGYRSNNTPVVCVPHKMNGLMRGIWNAGVCTRGRNLGDLDELALRQAVCIQADSFIGDRPRVRFGFKKARKVERFRQLFPEARELGCRDGVTWFSVPWRGVYSTLLDDNKTWRVENLLRLPLKLRQVFMEELQYWDSHVDSKTGRFSYSTVIKANADAVQAVAATTGFKTSVYCSPPWGNHKACYTVSIKQRDYTRSGTFLVDPLEGTHQVYCLSMPSSFVVVRDGGKPVCVGQCNFGLPGGLGGPKLVEYAKAQYGVILTLDEAVLFREKIITEVYPEIGWYLKDTTLDTLAHNLGLDPATCRQLINDCCDAPDAFAVSLAKVLKGTPIKANGDAYKRHWVQTCWNLLGVLVRNAPGATPAHREALLKREGSFEVHDLFLAEPAVTPTGRLRGGVRFTQRLNAPFQGLAADGAKRALWRALQAGLPVAAFVHDELIFEFPIERAEAMAVQAKKVMESSMSEVLNHAVPVEAEGHLTPCWTK